jgi:hypothetical protein
MGLYERDRVGDLRAVAAVSLSRDERWYRVGEPSLSRPIVFGDEEIGRSLGGEDIVRRGKKCYLVHKY